MADHNPDFIPGTVHLVDVSTQHTSGPHSTSHSDIVLVPQPSSDPEDPLNWTYRRKLLAVSMSYLYVLGTGIATSLQYSVLADITADTGISTADLVQGTGVMFLFFGWCCLIWQPIALTYGRRGVYLITMFLTIPIMVWTAYSRSLGDWYGHRVLIGIVVSPIESLSEVTCFDLFFAHNRGTYMGLYVFVLFGSNFLAPLVAGWFNDAYGWRWTMHLGTIICAVCLVVMFFFLEETIYFRNTALEGQDVKSEGSVGSQVEGKAGVVAKDDEWANVQTLPKEQSVSSTSTTTRPKKTLWEKYALFRPLPGRPSNRDMLKMGYRPLLMIFKFPNVAWAGFLYGINLSWYNVLNGTASPVLTGAPYNWSAAQVGSVYAGPIIGAGLACLWSGKAADWLALRLARRNKGIREAEHRLWVLTVSGIISAAGLILWGVGAYRQIEWIGLIAGETMVSIMIIRNTIGFGISYGITPWWTNQGLQNCFITAAAISLVCTFSFLVLVVYGKRLRKWSLPAYSKYMSTAIVALE
ncbi:major facilitator superfamily domain-containing protein [Elsinoe ampelina]|uniref:Major facilitator superfamily domain-containing protein n=1 Tax=Elsinoe ampelina TaxID=302913 RepID=A0A6A6G342_9PEZI|nr:major facilitator superfamily domain-containing protein [Elsinoe ampelina]